ncbi:hypothetical protein, partial [Dyella acidisoli]|uniref:hypothetical protein n=1 Tax=Dyella acidisoli TaxID=1867834 RepID=UPI0024E0D9F4
LSSHTRSGFSLPHAVSRLGHFFGLLFFGPAKKSDSGPLGSESAAGNASTHEMQQHGNVRVAI